MGAFYCSLLQTTVTFFFPRPKSHPKLYAKRIILILQLDRTISVRKNHRQKPSYSGFYVKSFSRPQKTFVKKNAIPIAIIVCFRVIVTVGIAKSIFLDKRRTNDQSEDIMDLSKTLIGSFFIYIYIYIYTRNYDRSSNIVFIKMICFLDKSYRERPIGSYYEFVQNVDWLYVINT